MSKRLQWALTLAALAVGGVWCYLQFQEMRRPLQRNADGTGTWCDPKTGKCQDFDLTSGRARPIGEPYLK